ncbi:hypothetical protein [Marinobacter zhejiangensis]|uniref:Uncharacterized protein n=1 Tax=Marinobacter zhejiangensis TaxID=488535 RepID=A0A1I4LJJ6_9GAMM|nr:hypothetical protein [Marinobacter zhejiangensis]SFL91099.1 hypothetical protein SAMN04487963_0511 [Marinobacter zhejiangensis]
MENFKKLALAAAISSSIALTGCGGSSGGSSSDTGGTGDTGGGSTATETGVFVDSAVIGINYTTSPSGQTGKTNDLGEYDYAPGDTVIFSIGGIDLPAVEATGRITPADMGNGGTDWGNDPTVINILRLLQTLDADGDPSNGISITEAIHTALQDIDLDPAISKSDFETQANSALGSTGAGLILIDEIDAINHFQDSQSGDLIGSWKFVEANGGINVLTFINDSEYLIAHSHNDGEEQRAASAEYGSYEWDSSAGTLTLTRIDQSDGSGGLADNFDTASWTMQLQDGAMVLARDGEEAVFTPVRNAKDSLVGSWYISDGPDQHNVLTILDDTSYVVAHSANQEAYGSAEPEAVSSEWGSYSFSGSTFKVTAVSAELDGPGGLYDAPSEGGVGAVDGPARLHPTGQLTLADNGADGNFTLRRLGRYSVTLKDFEGDTKQVYVEASGNDFMDVVQVFSFADIDGGAPTVSGTFDMTASESEEITITLDVDGAGDMYFEHVGETNVIDNNWSVWTSGALSYTEGGVEWTYLPVKGNGPYTTLIYQADMDLMFITNLNFGPM